MSPWLYIDIVRPAWHHRCIKMLGRVKPCVQLQRFRSSFYTTSLFPWGYSLVAQLLHTFPLAHRFLTVDDHLVGIVYNAVADGISQDRIANLFSPSGHCELRAEDRRSVLVPGFRNLQQISRLCFLQWVQQPFVQNQQRAFLIPLDHLPESTVGSCNGEFCQKLRQADIFH